MPAVEVFEPFAHAPTARRETYRFRSSWLASSLRALRRRELVDAYRAHLPPQFHAPILESVAGLWLPIDVALAHYAAIDALELPAQTAFDMGREIQSHAHAFMLKVAIQTSKAAGVTPWTVLGQLRKMWDRTWAGGDFAIYKSGPKQAELEIVEWSIAPSPYVRHAMRGIFHGVTEMFCAKVYVRELPQKCVGRGLGYRMAWV